ncbi:MAG: hypothetical protein SO253_02435 [Bacilli bacterium]|nr:hypothetical protein [Bacilli bacterium]
MKLKEFRQNLNIALIEASIITCVPVFTLIKYESDDSYGDNVKKRKLLRH